MGGPSLPRPARTHILSLVTAAALLTAVGAVPSRPRELRTNPNPNPNPNSISAAPSFLPAVPGFSAFPPASAPDGMPVLPTPRGRGSLPVIPSNPSPPNPDQFGPTSSLSPSGSSASAVVPSASASLRNSARAGGEAAACALLLLLLLLRWF